ncbi:MAG: glycosyltransferase [Alphaproteobacteria bacterium]|nr:glycosyltransferase [Alphaproteobacteria bacterium]MBV9695095.1 glycosyltransferase [Alphaproteobacteria bacterium]
MIAGTAALALAAWLYLLFGRGFFWLARERDDKDCPLPAAWPSVVAVVPARDEADVIARSVGSLMAQDYRGAFRVIVVDDQSSDGTADAARALGCAVLCGSSRPPGWTGKLWAVSQGVAAAGPVEYLWLTDADIDHAPDNLSKLVARAEAGRLVLTSLMAKLYCKSGAEKLLIPAFVFFFDMLFPFGWVNDPRHATAAAAGGCMLVKRSALESAGGIDAIRGEIIDDCALGRALKRQGPIWLGLTDRAVSLRRYEGIVEIRRMVARSAYAQLSYSPLLLAGTVLGMALLYAAPPLVATFARGPVEFMGLATWLMMALAFLPMLRFYRLSPLRGLALPVIGALYGLFTLDSAVQHWRGRGGMWKGRAQAMDGV